MDITRFQTVSEIGSASGKDDNVDAAFWLWYDDSGDGDDDLFVVDGALPREPRAAKAADILFTLLVAKGGARNDVYGALD